ncbi:hypothetical protein E2P81_ATG01824 [Venturia nashicola]|nr:hypothetical protein E2P81_ATG01824 [Venturia nashicola]
MENLLAHSQDGRDWNTSCTQCYAVSYWSSLAFYHQGAFASQTACIDTVSELCRRVQEPGSFPGGLVICDINHLELIPVRVQWGWSYSIVQSEPTFSATRLMTSSWICFQQGGMLRVWCNDSLYKFVRWDLMVYEKDRTRWRTFMQKSWIWPQQNLLILLGTAKSSSVCMELNLDGDDSKVHNVRTHVPATAPTTIHLLRSRQTGRDEVDVADEVFWMGNDEMEGVEGWKVDVGGWKVDVEGWKVDVGGWKVDVEGWKVDVENKTPFLAKRMPKPL